ncbi:MAG: IS110 family transposase, partial [Gemmatimonadetes bacterium]|nr:IS110 family transposase [Gemmatimonadota bacterium]
RTSVRCRRNRRQVSQDFAAIELSGKSWVIGVKHPGSGKVGLHTLKTPDTRGLIALIERHREDALKKIGSTVRVLCCYEAGFEGFWLARCLETNGYEMIVLDPSSLLVNRKARQRKTDRTDAKKMIRALLTHDRGDSQVLSRVRVPSVTEEDRKRFVKRRTSLTNTMKGLLRLQGITGVDPRNKDFSDRLGALKTGYGEPLGEAAQGELGRLRVHLELVQDQIDAVEAQRDKIVHQGKLVAGACANDCDSPDRTMARIALLTDLKGIGANDATLLVTEVFYRKFENRRELASWVGLTPTPWASGAVERDQGIGRDGPGWIRAMLVQMAWRWLRHQPDSALSKWFNDRCGGAKGRIRRVMIVALARKLVIALWRFAETGLVPDGAECA